MLSPKYQKKKKKSTRLSADTLDGSLPEAGLRPPWNPATGWPCRAGQQSDASTVNPAWHELP